MKKIKSLLIFFCFAIIFAGCRNIVKQEGEGQKSKGRYLEERIEFEDNSEPVKLLKREQLYMATNMVLYRSDDEGNTWNEEIELYKEDYMLTDMDMDGKGNMFLAYYCFETEDYYYFYGNREQQNQIVLPDFSKENYLSDITIVNDGRALAKDMEGNVFLLQPESGEITDRIETDDSSRGYLHQIAVLDEELYLFGEHSVEIYNWKENKFLKEDTVLSDFMKERAADELLVTEDLEEMCLYLEDTSGLYQYQGEQASLERVIDGGYNHMSDSLNRFYSFVQKDGCFYGLANYDGQSLIYKYEFSNKVSAVPGKVLRLYLMENSQSIQHAVHKFQNEYPDYYIEMQVGYSDEESITKEEALKKLNTEMIAGTGPDMIILDNMPVEQYIEKGMLYDLTGLAAEIKQENSFFESVLTPDTEQVYAINTRFRLPVAVGKKELIQGMESIEKIASECTNISVSEVPEQNIIGRYEKRKLIEQVLRLRTVSWINADGSVDEEEINNFLLDVKSISMNAGTEEDYIYTEKDYTMIDFLPDLLKENQSAGIMTLNNLYEFETMLTLIKDKEDWDYRLYGTGAENIFVPVDTIGISQKSDMIEESKKFIKFVLSANVQSAVSFETKGFPVNQAAFRESWQKRESYRVDNKSVSSIGIQLPEGSFYLFEVFAGKEKEYQKLSDQFEILNARASGHFIIEEALVEYGVLFFEERITAEETVDRILRRINLYLAEQDY